VRPEDYARLETNDVRVLWFDARRALVGPETSSVHTQFYLSDATELSRALAKFGPPCAPTATSSGHPICLWSENPRPALAARAATLAPYAPVWHLPAASFAPGDPDDHGQRLVYPVPFGETLELAAYEALPGEPLTLLTYWRVRAPATAQQAAPALKLFLHLLDAGGALVAGEDRLDVWHDNWQTGDLFVQLHEVTLPADAAPGRYQVELGVYDPETMQRLPVLREGAMIADRVLLAPVQAD
jgi:hypothetical protein